MADLSIGTFEQIETILSRVATNYSELALVFYDVFYNKTPMNVTFQMFDESGVLRTYTIPNRAKDFTYILNGNGNPEGSVVAKIGSIYQDILNGNLYIKQIDGGKTGWNEFIVKEDLDSYLLKGTSSPEGIISADKGVLFVDTSTSSLYIKTTTTGTTGWYLISANTENLADRNLSNLTSLGELKFANPSLSNLSIDGQALMNSKEDKSNKTTTLSPSSNNDQYPSAKSVYDYVNTRVEASANVNLSNLSDIGESKFLGMSQVGDCILSAPRGLTSNSGNQIILPNGTILLGAAGLTSSKTLKNEKVAIETSVSTVLTWREAADGIVFYDSRNNILRCCKLSNFYISKVTPAIEANTDIWFNPDLNEYHYTRGGNWEKTAMTRIAEFKTDSRGDISSFSPIYPVGLVTKYDLEYAIKRIEKMIANLA